MKQEVRRVNVSTILLPVVGILCTLSNWMFSSSLFVICISPVKNFLSIVSVSLGDPSSSSLAPKNLLLLRRLKHSCLITRRSSSFILMMAVHSSQFFGCCFDLRFQISHLCLRKLETFVFIRAGLL